MSKITFLHDDPTYAPLATKPCGMVRQDASVHIIYGITPVDATPATDLTPAMPAHFEAQRIEFKGNPDYPTLVSLLVRDRYPANDVEAIILNHGDGNPDHEAQYTALQQWRTEAKSIAHTILGV